jgi:hypothetical protein
MRQSWALFAAAGCLAFVLPRAAEAGGAWVPAPGDGDVTVGYSDKTAVTSWDADGNVFTNHQGGGQRSYHDFRYGYLSGEVGLLKNLSGTFLVTYLDGFEGPKATAERNSGLSDAWFGLKYSLRQGATPMALGFTLRTPVFYDLPGTYNRHLFDQRGNIRGNSPEWRGVLKHDYTVSYLVSRSLFDGRGWGNLQVGYNWREGAPADDVPIYAELGLPLPFWGANVKVATGMVFSRHNNSTPQPDDRFGGGSGFNDASMAKLGVGFLQPLAHGRYYLELGYNQWVWGKSARRYKEPYISINRRF